MSKVSLSVVIGTYNRIEILKQCLASLIGKVQVKNEIIVVDAGSTDGTIEYLHQLKGIRVICDNKLIGQAKSLNQVFNSLNSRYVCWLSDDNVALPGMLDQAVSILKWNPTIGMVSLKVKDISGPIADQQYLGWIWPTGILNCNQGVLPLRLLKKLGGFDEQFRDYGIDIDLTTRVLLAGKKVVFTKRVAIHHLRDHDTSSWTDKDGRTKKMDKARELYSQKYEGLIKSEFGGSYDKKEREDSLELKQIYDYYKIVKRKNIPAGDVIAWSRVDKRLRPVILATWVGLVERDWKNLLVARFISRKDFLINLIKPYYLVQNIPVPLLRKLKSDKRSALPPMSSSQ